MTPDKARLKVMEFGNALGRLREILAVPSDHIGRLDAVIQRFEFCYELSWKALRHMLEIYGHQSAAPRQCFQKAYAMGWLETEAVWVRMIEDRNMTVHTYKEERALDIALRIPEYQSAMETLHAKLVSILNTLK